MAYYVHAWYAGMGAVIYSSGMCVDCYKEYLENAGGQLQGHNPPAYTRGLIKASKQQVSSIPLATPPLPPPLLFQPAHNLRVHRAAYVCMYACSITHETK